jgi:outer membrane protein assembly factor BamB
MMLRVTKDGEKLNAEKLFRLEPGVFGAEQQTPILFGGHIYGVRQDKQMACLDLKGNLIWSSGSDTKFGLGPFVIADGLLYAMDDSGLLRLIEATSGGYVQLAEAKVLEGHDSWGPMAVASGRLLLRDLNRMICLDITRP